MPLHPAITADLEQTELELKKLRGVRLASTLEARRNQLAADVANHASNHASNHVPNHDGTHLAASDTSPRDDAAWLAHFAEHHGTPAQAAATARDALDTKQPTLAKGHAPGWRVACARCGRSSPLSLAARGYRVGARSLGPKYGVIYCSDCNGFRWGRHTRDMDVPAVTAALGEHRTADDLLGDNRPWLTVATIVGTVAAVVALAGVIPLLF
ncbi:MAG: hypothetical protein AAF235_01945 [Planctomycetota bacterium]